MKKLYVLSLIVAFLFLGAQAMASPPVPPPPEGFIITTDTDITCEGKVTETEKYNWEYFSGVGNISAATSGTDLLGHAIITTMGFNAGAQIAYEQTFEAVNGKTTFVKHFAATSESTPNLSVDKDITFAPIAGVTGNFATHTEKVAMAIVSAGATSATAGTGLLSLCPWAGTNTSTGGGYPATNEGIAAGSSFAVTEIDKFISNVEVTTTKTPELVYNVEAKDGKGTIRAGFVVELWEGNSAWGYHDIGSNAAYGTNCDTSVNTVGTFAQNPVPLVASRTSYAEHASATGSWTFNKDMHYKSVMPGASATTGTISSVP